MRFSSTLKGRSVTAALVVLGIASGGALIAAPATALPPGPGTPGVPANPVVVFHEDFQNSTSTGAPVMLNNYVSATPGVRYTADPSPTSWLDPTACNGFVMSPTNTPSSLGCGFGGQLAGLAQVLGQVNGSGSANAAVAAYTMGDPGADRVEFQTVGEPITMSAPNRFVTFSVNAAAMNCFASHPLLMFSVVSAGIETPISKAPIDPCTDPRATTTAPGGFIAGTFAADGSFITNGSTVGIVMRNHNGSGAGNDGAFDDIKVLDVTPQLDQSFSTPTITNGGDSTLTFTITNTSELAAKDGWSFTNTLPAGLVVAPSMKIGGTCNASTAAAPGSSTIAVTAGNLTAGETSCTITVPVTPAAGQGSTTFAETAANVTKVIGLDKPGTTSIRMVKSGIAIAASPNTTKLPVAGQTVTYTLTATNTGDSTLTSPTITLPAFSGKGTAPKVVCPQTASLAPGAKLVCTATYTVVPADVTAGALRLTAASSGSFNGVTVTSLPQASVKLAIVATVAGVAVETGGTTPTGAGTIVFWTLLTAGILAAAVSVIMFTGRKNRA